MTRVHSDYDDDDGKAVAPRFLGFPTKLPHTNVDAAGNFRPVVGVHSSILVYL